jgi:redox-sensitive bicupin YhaK (pirin superfamily)
MKIILFIFSCISAFILYENNFIIDNFLSILLEYLPNKTMTDTKINNTLANSTTDFKGLPIIPANDPSLTKADDMAVPRVIKQSFLAISQAEGAGARVRRSIGVPKLRNLTPFLMLDHFSVPPSAGFPDHPHKHFETITYLLSGSIDHEDFAGNKGTIGPGDLQFMTAGRGIVHAEMPGQNSDGSPNVGLQLWVDLPKALKYCEPRYRDLRKDEIPVDVSEDGKVSIKVISGQTKQGVSSQQELSYTPVWLFDVTIKPGGKLVQPIPSGWNTFAYSMNGTVTFGGGVQRRTIEAYHNTVFEQAGDTIVAEVDADATEDARFIIAAGMPLDQPVVQYGPFVGTSVEQVQQAFFDYQTYTNGFERAKGWASDIGKRMTGH